MEVFGSKHFCSCCNLTHCLLLFHFLSLMSGQFFLYVKNQIKVDFILYHITHTMLCMCATITLFIMFNKILHLYSLWHNGRNWENCTWWKILYCMFSWKWWSVHGLPCHADQPKQSMNAIKQMYIKGYLSDK